ncbi:MAG TPA: hypothetical protein VJ927_04625, partial [Actinomycetota bacterium]|nr:hypothetical protein [Actinomycetota bacterium]
TERGALSPAVAFAVLVITLAAILAAFGIFDRRGSDREPTPAPAPTATPTEEDLSLTDAEAIARFEDLDALRIRALEDRDLTRLGETFTPTSPMAERVTRTVLSLRRQNTIVQEHWDLRQVEVLSNGTADVEIGAIAISDVTFTTEEGDEVTGRARREERTLECTLHLVGDAWLLHECDVVRVKPLA